MHKFKRPERECQFFCLFCLDACSTKIILDLIEILANSLRFLPSERVLVGREAKSWEEIFSKPEKESRQKVHCNPSSSSHLRTFYMNL